MEMLKRDSLMFKLAYGIDAKVPTYTTTCRLTRKALQGLVTWPILIAGEVILRIILVVSFILFARKVNLHSGDMSEQIMPWPTLSGHRIWPLSVIGPGLLAYLLYGYGQLAIISLWNFWKDSWPTVSIVLLLGILAAGLFLFYDSEAWNLLSSRLKDWKDKRCRIIPIEPEEKKS